MPDANKEHTINQVYTRYSPLPSSPPPLPLLFTSSSPPFISLPPLSPSISLLSALTHLPSQLVGAAFGAAGQRCMALSTAIFVGKSQEWIPEIVERAKQLKTNAGEG